MTHNPWLEIPEADYVGHMESALVGQRPVLRRLFGEILQLRLPQHVLLLGSTDGNGLESVDARVTSRVSCVDVNPVYLDSLRLRFPEPDFALDLHCADLLEHTFEGASFDLVHAALVFEYLDWRALLPRLVEALRPNGTLSLILQRPSAATPAVTPTPFTSLRRLEALFSFVDGDALTGQAASLGLTLVDRTIAPLPGGKSFDVLQLLLRSI
jgi:hypothetical protein